MLVPHALALLGIVEAMAAVMHQDKQTIKNPAFCGVP
jgi:hypothetical protein